MSTKINVEEVVIDGSTYVKKDSLLKSPNYTGDIKIVILQRGWIYIGRFSRNGNDCQLNNAYCIRTWGTTKGLQELVNGATSNTKNLNLEFDWLKTIKPKQIQTIKI
jgi:hypothetical protein